MKKEFNLAWRIHTPNLLNEVLSSNPGMAIMDKPFNILGKLLAQVGERAAELNDPQLNALMCQLTIYSIADPTGPDYDAEVVREIIKKHPNGKA